MNDLKPKSAEVNHKHFILSALTILVGLLAFWSWHALVPDLAEVGLQVRDFAWPVVSLSLAAIFFSFTPIFIKNDWLVHFACLVGVASAYFFIPANSATVWAMLATVFLIVLALHKIKHEVELSTGFSLSKTLKSGLPLYFTAASLIVSIFYFEATKTNEEKVLAALFPKPASSAALKILSSQLESLVGFPLKIGVNSTVDEIMLQLVQEQLEGDKNLSALPKKELEGMLALQRQEIAKRYNLPRLTGREKVSDVFHNVVLGHLQKIVEPYKLYLPFVSALAFFLAFKTFTLPLYYATLLLAFVLLKLAILAKIIRIEKEQIEVEKLAL